MTCPPSTGAERLRPASRLSSFIASSRSIEPNQSFMTIVAPDLLHVHSMNTPTFCACGRGARSAPLPQISEDIRVYRDSLRPTSESDPELWKWGAIALPGEGELMHARALLLKAASGLAVRALRRCAAAHIHGLFRARAPPSPFTRARRSRATEEIDHTPTG